MAEDFNKFKSYKIKEWLAEVVYENDADEDDEEDITSVVKFFKKKEIGARRMKDLLMIYKTDAWYELVEDKEKNLPKDGLELGMVQFKKLIETLDGMKNGNGSSAVTSPKSMNGPQSQNDFADSKEESVSYPTLSQTMQTQQITQQTQVITQVVKKNESSYYEKLVTFYKAYKPDKLNDPAGLQRLLEKYQGREEQLFRDLEKKYILGADREQIQFKKKAETKAADQSMSILEALSKIYASKVRPLEEMYSFPTFHTPLMNKVDFLAKPMVLLVGQYSVGKTSFIRFLIGREFPGIRIGPEPTTDAFHAVMYGRENMAIPGHTVPMQQDKPFKSLLQFGDGFLSKFHCAEVNAPILESLSFIDTPGILSGAKQRLGRNYDFAKVVEWFAYRCDRILLLFDAHKLDISDEFKASIEVLKGHDDKIRCVLNKADAVTNQQLLRVYGALMWSLGKVFKTPEVLRVYVGSFWDQPYKDKHNELLFDHEADDLISDLKSLPRHCATRKINEFMKRVRQLRVHCFICSHLKNEMPMFNKNKKQQELLDKLPQVFKEIAANSNQITKDHAKKMTKKNKKKKKKGSVDDTDDAGGMNDRLLIQNFPDPRKFKPLVAKFDFAKFPTLDDQQLACFDSVFTEIPQLLRKLPSSKANAGQSGADDEKSGGGGGDNPFAHQGIENAKIYTGKGYDWVVDQVMKNKYDQEFYSLQGTSQGIASPEAVAAKMRQYCGGTLGNDVLRRIYGLADIDKSRNGLDSDEFGLTLYFIDLVRDGSMLPQSLSAAQVPPSKRHLVQMTTVSN